MNGTRKPGRAIADLLTEKLFSGEFYAWGDELPTIPVALLDLGLLGVRLFEHHHESDGYEEQVGKLAVSDLFLSVIGAFIQGNAAAADDEDRAYRLSQLAFRLTMGAFLAGERFASRGSE